MNAYIKFLKSSYIKLADREKFSIMILSWAMIYVIFHFTLFSYYGNEEAQLQSEIKVIDQELSRLTLEVDTIKKISNSPVYKEWISQQKIFVKLKGKYISLLQFSHVKQLQDIIKTLLQAHVNVIVKQIKNEADITYSPGDLKNVSIKLQKLPFLVIVQSNYFDTISYLQKLERFYTLFESICFIIIYFMQ